MNNFEEFSDLVYRCPGVHFGPEGTTYDFQPVSNSDQQENFVSKGWYKSLAEAVEAHKRGS